MAEAVETAAGLEPVAADWDALARRAGAAPFLRPGWIAAWCEAFDEGPPTVLALRREGRLAGVIPVISEGGRVRSPTNWHTPSFGPVAEDRAARQSLLAALFGQRPRQVDLAFLCAEDDDLECLRQVAGPYRVEHRVVIRSPYLPIDQEWDVYWSGLSKNLRKTVNRCRNRLADLGEVDLDVSDGRERLDEQLEEGFRLEASGWKGEQETAISSRSETRRFYASVARWAAAEGILRLAFLRIDGRAVAFHLCLEDQGAHYLLKPGHDAKLQRAGPGTVLTARMVERAFELGLERYEFLGDEDEYKRRWAERRHDLLRVQAFAPTLRGRVDRFLQVRARGAARAARRASARLRGPSEGH